MAKASRGARSTVAVTCSKCKHDAEIMSPDGDHPAEVVWRCPAPLANGVDLCGHSNTIEIQ